MGCLGSSSLGSNGLYQNEVCNVNLKRLRSSTPNSRMNSYSLSTSPMQPHTTLKTLHKPFNISSRGLYEAHDTRAKIFQPKAPIYGKLSYISLHRGPKDPLHIRISYSGSKARYKGIPEIMLCRILMSSYILPYHTILRHTIIYSTITYHTTYHIRILMFMCAIGTLYYSIVARPSSGDGAKADGAAGLRSISERSSASEGGR